ncbi:MAG: hypothetical protein ACO4CZ_17490, partial [Planctomycetota bacterium]
MNWIGGTSWPASTTSVRLVAPVPGRIERDRADADPAERVLDDVEDLDRQTGAARDPQLLRLDADVEVVVDEAGALDRHLVADIEADLDVVLAGQDRLEQCGPERVGARLEQRAAPRFADRDQRDVLVDVGLELLVDDAERERGGRSDRQVDLWVPRILGDAHHLARAVETVHEHGHPVAVGRVRHAVDDDEQRRLVRVGLDVEHARVGLAAQVLAPS